MIRLIALALVIVCVIPQSSATLTRKLTPEEYNAYARRILRHRYHRHPRLPIHDVPDVVHPRDVQGGPVPWARRLRLEYPCITGLIVTAYPYDSDRSQNDTCVTLIGGD